MTPPDEENVSLRDYLTFMVAKLEQRLDQRFDAMQRAIDVAYRASEARLDSVNEFRAQLSDQTRTFVTREVVDARVNALRAELEGLRRDFEDLRKKLG